MGPNTFGGTETGHLFSLHVCHVILQSPLNQVWSFISQKQSQVTLPGCHKEKLLKMIEKHFFKYKALKKLLINILSHSYKLSPSWRLSFIVQQFRSLMFLFIFITRPFPLTGGEGVHVRVSPK